MTRTPPQPIFLRRRCVGMREPRSPTGQCVSDPQIGIPSIDRGNFNWKPNHMNDHSSRYYISTKPMDYCRVTGNPSIDSVDQFKMKNKSIIGTTNPTNVEFFRRRPTSKDIEHIKPAFIEQDNKFGYCDPNNVTQSFQNELNKQRSVVSEISPTSYSICDTMNPESHVPTLTSLSDYYPKNQSFQKLQSVHSGVMNKSLNQGESSLIHPLENHISMPVSYSLQNEEKDDSNKKYLEQPLQSSRVMYTPEPSPIRHHYPWKKLVPKDNTSYFSWRLPQEKNKKQSVVTETLSNDDCVTVARLRSQYENILALEKEEKNILIKQYEENIKSLQKELKITQDIVQGKEYPTDLSHILQTKEENLITMFKHKNDHIYNLKRLLNEERALRYLLKNDLHSTETSSIPNNVNSSDTLQKLKRLLTYRETQLKQADIVVQTRQNQYKGLLKELAIKDHIVNQCKKYIPQDAMFQSVTDTTGRQIVYLESEVSSMREMIDELRYEKQELQILLIQKDKQLACLSGVDKSMKESSAIQLGVQAIAMVQSSAELKERIQVLETESEHLHEQVYTYKERLDQCHKKLTDKRHEAAHLTETIAVKDMQIARLDTFLEQREKEILEVQDNSRFNLCQEKEISARFKAELQISEKQHERLREELSRRDDSILNLKSEVVRQSKYNKDAEIKIKTLSGELEDAQRHMEKIIKESLVKTEYMIQFERSIKENDLSRQETYLKELAKNRELRLSLQLKDHESVKTLQTKNEEISLLKSNLVASSQQVEAVKHVLCQPIDLHSKQKEIICRTKVLNPLPKIAKKCTIKTYGDDLQRPFPIEKNSQSFYPNDSTKIRDQSLKGKNAVYKNAKSCDETLHNIIKEEPFKNRKKLISSCYYKCTNTNPIVDHIPLNSTHKTSTIKNIITNDTSIRQPPRTSDMSLYLSTPIEGIDIVLRQALKKKEWRQFEHLFQRIGPAGAYLCGRKPIRLKKSVSGSLECQVHTSDDKWLPFDLFMKYLIVSDNNENE